MSELSCFVINIHSGKISIKYGHKTNYASSVSASSQSRTRSSTCSRTKTISGTFAFQSVRKFKVYSTNIFKYIDSRILDIQSVVFTAVGRFSDTTIGRQTGGGVSKRSTVTISNFDKCTSESNLPNFKYFLGPYLNIQ